MTQPARAFTRALLSDLHTWWLKDVPTQHDASIPKSAFQRWFMQSSELDEKCWRDYGKAVEEAGNMSVGEIEKVVESPEDAVAAVILLDQLPRNMFRGKEAAKAYKIYDPKARDLAKLYLIDRNLTKRDQFTHFGQGYFLYMPFMHSEDIADHDKLKSLIDTRRSEAQSDAERSSIDLFMDFENKHRGAVLERFGRYPSRNDALERTSTKEEEEHMKEGTGW